MVTPLRSRISVVYSFALLGVVLGSWASRTKALQEQVGVSEGDWGLLLMVGPVGTLFGFALVKLLVERVSARTMLIAAVPLIALGPALFTQAESPTTFAIFFFLNGVLAGFFQTPLNTNAVYVERRYGRPIMGSFHAWFSVGLLIGGLVAFVAAATDLELRVQMPLVGGALLLGFLFMISALPRDKPAPPTDALVAANRRGGRRFVVSAQLALLGLIAFSSSFGEGAATLWSNQYVAKGFDASDAVATLGFVAYVCTAIVTRVLSDGLIARLGRRRFLQLACSIALAGMVTGLAMNSLAGAFLVVASMGFGFAGTLPTVFSAAGNQPGYSAASGIATVTLLYWPAFLLGSPLIGAVSDATSLRTAFVIPVVSATLVAVLATWIKEPKPRDERAVPEETTV